MGPSNENIEKDGPDGDLQSRWLVSSFIFRTTFSRLITKLKYSICILSIVRIDANNRLNYSDITYSAVLNRTCSALEPTLGVINACLPILQPVVSKCCGSTMFSWSRSRLSVGTSSRRLKAKGTPCEPSGGPQSGRFHRMPADLYPLTDVTTTQIHCSGPGNAATSDNDADSFIDELAQHSGIKVKQRVEIDSAVAPPSQS